MTPTIASVTVPGTLVEKVTASADAGFAGIEIFDEDLVASTISPADLARLATDHGIRLEVLQPLRDFEANPPQPLKDAINRALRMFDVAEQMDVGTVLICSNTSRLAIDDDDLAAEQLNLVGELAAQRGLRVAFEALAWGRHVNDYEHAHRLVTLADHPAVGTCLDAFHIFARRSDLAGIQSIDPRKLFLVQVSDAPMLDVELREWSRHHRVFPGAGQFDVTGYLEAIVATGYQGSISLEIFNQTCAADPADVAMEARSALNSALRART